MRYWNGEMVRSDVWMVTCPCNHNDGYCCRVCFCRCCCCSCCSFLNKGIEELMRHLKGSRLKRGKGLESLRSTPSENQSWTQMNLTEKRTKQSGVTSAWLRYLGGPTVAVWDTWMNIARIVEPTSRRNPAPNDPSGLTFQVVDVRRFN